MVMISELAVTALERDLGELMYLQELQLNVWQQVKKTVSGIVTKGTEGNKKEIPCRWWPNLYSKPQILSVVVVV